MSRKLPKLSTTSITQTTDIAALQDKLLKSLNSVFDPTMASKSDENFLATEDYTLESTQLEKIDEYKNPYQSLAEKAKAYVRQKEAEVPKKQDNSSKKTNKPVAKKDLDTFLTGVGLEGNQRKESLSEEEPVEEKEPLPEIDYKDVLGSANQAGEYDDLAELRRMIKDTKKEMKDYGKELLDLKNIISDMNDFASKELGYSANNDLLRNMESTINDLGQGKTFKFMKKSQSSSKNIKAPLPATTTTTTAEKVTLPKASGNKIIIKPSTSNYFQSRTSKSGIESFSGRLKKF